MKRIVSVWAIMMLVTYLSAGFWKKVGNVGDAIIHPDKTEDRVVTDVESDVSSGVQSVGQSFDSNALLFKAIDKGKPKEVKRLLDPSPHMRTFTGFVEKAAAPVAADPNALFTYDVIAGYRYGTTPLMVAAYRNYPSIVKILLAYGADVNNKKSEKSNYSNDIRYTPLMVAAYHGHPAVVKVLLDHGADTKISTNKSVVSGDGGVCKVTHKKDGMIASTGSIGDGLGHCRNGVTALDLAQVELDKLMKHPKKNRKRIKDYKQVVTMFKKV